MTEQTNDDGYLKKLFLKNIINSFVEVTASDSFNNNGKPDPNNFAINLLNWTDSPEIRYFSSSTTNPFIIIEFKRHIPKIYGYLFETHGDKTAQSFPNYWIVKGSNSNTNKNQWEILDERRTPILESLSRKAIFHMKPCQYKYIKFIQLNNTYDKSHSDYARTFSLRHIDFYTIQQCTINCNKYNRISHLFYIAILL